MKRKKHAEIYGSGYNDGVNEALDSVAEELERWRLNNETFERRHAEQENYIRALQAKERRYAVIKTLNHIAAVRGRLVDDHNS